MSEQIDQLNKMKTKIDKEKHAKRLQVDEAKAAQDAVANERASVEKQNKMAQNSLSGDDNIRSLVQPETPRINCIVSFSDISRRVEEEHSNLMWLIWLG